MPPLPAAKRIAAWRPSRQLSIRSASIFRLREAERGELLRHIAGLHDRRGRGFGRSDQLIVDARGACRQFGQLADQRRAIGMAIKPRDIIQCLAVRQAVGLSVISPFASDVRVRADGHSFCPERRRSRG